MWSHFDGGNWSRSKAIIIEVGDVRWVSGDRSFRFCCFSRRASPRIVPGFLQVAQQLWKDRMVEHSLLQLRLVRFIARPPDLMYTNMSASPRRALQEFA